MGGMFGLNTSVVNENIQAAKGTRHIVHDSNDVAFVRRIPLNEPNLYVGMPRFRRLLQRNSPRLLCFIHIFAIVNGYVAAFLRQSNGDRLAYTRARPCNQGDFTDQSFAMHAE